MKSLHFFSRSVSMAASFLLILSGAISCTFDDTELQNSIDDLTARIEALENFQEQVQGDIASLQEIIAKLQSSVTVNNVVETENGYTINFSDGTSVTISNGKDGMTPPSITVVEEGGTYYWAYENADGTTEFIRDGDGNKIPVTGEAPQVRINEETGNWEISTDGGQTWEDTEVKAEGSDGDSFFKNVYSENGILYLVLSDGTTIQVPMTAGLAFDFRTEEAILYFEAGESKTLDYTMSGQESVTITKPDGWRASIEAEGLVITAPVAENEFAETEGVISVILISANGQSFMAEQQVAIGSSQEVQAPKIGDYYYSDGTWSDGGLISIDLDGLNPVWAETKPAPVDGKQVIGIVCQTFRERIADSDYEAGWTHGYVMAIRNAHGPNKNTTSWSLDYYFDCLDGINLSSSWYQNLDGYLETMTVKETYGENIAQMPAFDWTVTDFPLPAPEGTSGWFLPSTGQLWDMVANFSGHDVAAIMKEWSTQDLSAAYGYASETVGYDVVAQFNSIMSMIPADQKEEIFITHDFYGTASIWASTPRSQGETACIINLGNLGVTGYGLIELYEEYQDGDCIARPILAF